MIDFRLRTGVVLRDPIKDSNSSYDFDDTMGIGFGHNGTLRFNVYDIYLYLSIPRQMRNPAKNKGDELVNIFASRNVKFDGSGYDWILDSFTWDMDLAKIVSSNLGVDLTWPPHEKNTWITNWLIAFVGIGIGFIPAIGPGLAIAFTLTTTAITNPDNFISDTVLFAPDDVMGALMKSGKEAQKYVPPSFIVEGDAARDPTTALRAATSTESTGAASLLFKALREKYEREGAMKPSPWFASRVPRKTCRATSSTSGGFRIYNPREQGNTNLIRQFSGQAVTQVG